MRRHNEPNVSGFDPHSSGTLNHRHMYAPREGIDPTRIALLVILTVALVLIAMIAIGCKASLRNSDGTELEIDTRGNDTTAPAPETSTVPGGAAPPGNGATYSDVLAGAGPAAASGERQWNQWLRAALAASNARVRSAMKARDDVARRAADAFTGVE